MSDRGEYRSLYCVFWDDADVHALSDGAYRVLTTLKGTFPPSGIGFIYPSVLADRCGKDASQIEAALQELERPKQTAADGLGWIVRERNVVWIVNALRYEPNLNCKNEKHRKYIAERLLAPFGDRPIVVAFRRYYADWCVDAAPLPSMNGIREGIEGVSKHSHLHINSNPIIYNSQIEEEVRSPADPDADSEPLTALALVVWSNTAVAERWGEQTNPYTQAGAAVLLDLLIPLKVEPCVVRTSIYRQCREIANPKPPRTVKYFLQGIEEDWAREQARRSVAASGERPPPRRAKSARTTPASPPSPSPSTSPYADRFTTK